MVRPNQEAIETFMSITGASEAVAVQKLEERGGDLNEAVNAYFNDGDGNIIRDTSATAPEDDFMDIDEPSQVELRRPPFSLLSSAPRMNPFSLLDPNFRRSLLDSGPEISAPTPFVSHPREVREIPIEVKDGNEQSSQSGLAPTIEDVTGTAHSHDPEIRGTVIIDDDDDDDDEDIPSGPTANAPRQIERNRPSAPGIDEMLEYNNDIEEEMIQAAIEASKKDAEKVYPDQQAGASNDLSDSGPQQRQSQPDDTDLAHAVSLSLKTAEREKALREQGEKVGEKVESSESEANKSAEVVELGKLASSSGRQSRSELGSSSMQNEAGDVEEQPLVRRRSRRNSSGSVESIKEVEEGEVSPPSSPGQQDNVSHPLRSGNDFPSDEWGGISSEEHDEAVMLEAALFGGIPEGSAYPPFAYAPHQLMQNGFDRPMGPHPERMPRPPSPGLTAQRLIREQQDDEYLASLQADREKELKAMEEAEARRLEEQAAKAVALEEERRIEEELRKKLEEEQEVERQLAAKEASLPKEPTSEDENAVTLLVRLPDGSRRGRRFLKTDKLQSLFNFIDVGRVVKPGTYRLVRPYPRRAFSDGESALTLNELGLTSKQEALFLELI